MNKNNSISNSKLLPKGFTPGPNDVLVGRGKKCYEHVGNIKFREIVATRLEEYSAATTKQGKTDILISIIHQVRKNCSQNEGKGGFLKKDSETGLWYEVGDFLAKEKTSQAFRDALQDTYKSSNSFKKRRRQNEKRAKILARNRLNGGGADGKKLDAIEALSAYIEQSKEKLPMWHREVEKPTASFSKTKSSPSSSFSSTNKKPKDKNMRELLDACFSRLEKPAIAMSSGDSFDVKCMNPITMSEYFHLDFDMEDSSLELSSSNINLNKNMTSTSLDSDEKLDFNQLFNKKRRKISHAGGSNHSITAQKANRNLFSHHSTAPAPAPSLLQSKIQVAKSA